MRFLVAAGGEPLARARPTVRWFLLFALLLLVALVAQRGLGGGLLPEGVAAHYLGADGAEPVAAAALWEEVHVNAFVYGFLLVVLGSLHVAGGVPARTRSALLALSGAAALADLFSPFVVVAARGAGALRVATFAAVVGLLLADVAIAFLRFGRSGKGVVDRETSA